MKMKTTEQKGFTLLEIVVSLAVITIMTVVVGRGLVEMVSGYIFAKKNAMIAQQGQIAMTRLKKEFSNIKSVNSATATSITFVRNANPPDPSLHTISWAGGSNPLLCDNSDTLIGNVTGPIRVTSFNLNYYDYYRSSASPSYSASTSIIEITLQLSGGAANTTTNLTDRVNLWLATGA
jgi:prepilin-type N-terminal cleavage/methylation domain-containing protein